jgi:hypothetical protein
MHNKPVVLVTGAASPSTRASYSGSVFISKPGNSHFEAVTSRCSSQTVLGNLRPDDQCDHDKEMTMSSTQIKSSTKLGATLPEVFPIALGCMAMSGIYGKNRGINVIASWMVAISRTICWVSITSG